MIADLKPYSEYKESGLPWLGQVPGHWELPAIRRVFRAVTHRDIRGDEVKMSMSRHLGLVPSARLGSRSSAKSESISYSVCHVGELVMNKYQAHAGLFGCATHRGLITSNYTVFKPSPNATAAFFAKLFSSKPYQTAFEVESYGVGDGMSPLYTGVFYRIFTVLPPLAEQAAIVRFLDWANGRLEQTIRSKRKVIELLNEQRQATIHRAVTRGLDPSVPLKPSGIPWLGDIPQHWEVARVCRLFRQVIRYTARGDEPKMSMSRRHGLVRSDQLSNRAAQAATSIKFSVCEPSDLVLNKYQAHNGLFGAAIERGLITSNYSIFEPASSAFTEFYAFLFASPLYRAEFRMRCQGVGDGMMPLYSDAFLKTPTIAPPAAEQRSIVAFIADSTKEVAETISRLEREIELLREYRTRLVADVVTGKLDVREAAARLPDEVPLDLVEDDAELVDETEAADEAAAI
jgi:type I restriction enzyme S subunit